MSKAYGGSRHGVVEAETRTGQNRNMLDYLARSNSDAYESAYSKFATDRASSIGVQTTNASNTQGDFIRKMQGGAQFAGFGAQAQGMDSEAINNLVKTGAIDQATADSMIQGDYREFLRMQDAPMERYMQMAGILSGTPTNKSTTGTETTSQKSSLLGQLIGAGATAASFFSDRRLKTDIAPLGRLRSGLRLYAFRYLWSPVRHVGVMADEARALVPAAVSRVFGFDLVDYRKLGVE